MFAEMREIPSGDDGTYATLDVMRALATRQSAHPSIRGLAVDLARGHSRHDIRGQIAALRRWLVGHVRFLRDPVSHELIHDPVLLVEQAVSTGTALADCDDVATLGAALGAAIGIPARFVVVGFDGPDAPFEHVWAELYDGNAWRELDITRTRSETHRISRQAALDVATGERVMMPVRYMGAYRRPSQLGFIDPMTAAAAISTAQKVFGTSQHPKDAERYRQNQEAYTRAVNGEAAWLEWLAHRGGQGSGNIEDIGMVDPWTTDGPRDDAYAKWQAAKGVLAQSKGGIVVRTPGGTGSVGVDTGTLVVIGLAAALFFMKRRRS